MLLDRYYVLFLVVGLLWIACGFSSAFFPEASIIFWRRVARKLRMVSERKINKPIGKIRVFLERVEGCIFLPLGIAISCFVLFQFCPVFGDPVPNTVESKPIKSVEQLIALAQQCPADIGFYGKNFTTGKTVEHHADKPACLASIVKLFVLAEVMQQVDQGEVELSESITITRSLKKEIYTVTEALDKMIGVSDNEATDALAALVGYDRVNTLPKELRIEGLSENILPEPGVLVNMLDKRVFSKRHLANDELLPQHGTARGMVRFFELLHEKKLVNEDVTDLVLAVLDRNPKPFAGARPVSFYSVGKGGSIVWERLIRPQYNMVGWALYVHSQSEAAAFCVWFEWFPRLAGEKKKQLWYDAISNGIVQALLEDVEKQQPVSSAPSFASAVALVENEAGIKAWEELMKNLDTEAFVKSVQASRVPQSVSPSTNVIPMVVCQNTLAKAHFTWRWRGPDGAYHGSEAEFAPGRLWGWLPVVELKQEGLWRFEIGYNGKKIFDQQVMVKKHIKGGSL